MKVILTKPVESLGEISDIINVKDGYARNFLIPRGLALKASDTNLKIFEEAKRVEKIREKKIKQEALTLSKKLEKTSCTITVKTEDDKMFGAVTSMDIAKAYSEQGIDLDKTDILLKEPIKELGIYNVSVKLHSEVTTEVKVWVVKE